MRAADRIGAIVLLVAAVAYSATAARLYTYRDANGPGAGFFPVWLGVALAILAAILLVGAVRRPDPGPAWLPGGHGAARVLAVVAATAAFIAVMPWVGMTLGTALFLAALLRLLEGHSWPATIGTAAGVTAANWAVFTWWLRVPFPEGLLGF